MSPVPRTLEEVAIARINSLASEEEQRQEQFAKMVLARARELDPAGSKFLDEVLELKPVGP